MEKPNLYVRIYPSGKPNTQVVKLFFDNKPEKDSYILAELNFCKKEFDKYLTSDGERRTTAKEKYLLKRVSFAKQMKFAPLNRGNKFIWVREKIKPLAIA